MYHQTPLPVPPEGLPTAKRIGKYGIPVYGRTTPAQEAYFSSIGHARAFSYTSSEPSPSPAQPAKKKRKSKKKKHSTPRQSPTSLAVASISQASLLPIDNSQDESNDISSLNSMAIDDFQTIPRRSLSPKPTGQFPAVQPQLATTSQPTGNERFSRVNFDKLEVKLPPTDPFVTILFRPSSGSLHKINSHKLFKELMAQGLKPVAVRNILRGGLALDFEEGSELGPLLSITSLLDLPVSAKLPANKTSREGVITGVHFDISDEDIQTDSRTDPPMEITAVKRLAKPGTQSWTVKLTFSGTKLPNRLFLGGKSHRIRDYIARPTICKICARYGHTASLCQQEQRCWTCAQAHPTSECTNQELPNCSACGGPHPTNSTICQTYKFQTKIRQIQATTQSTYKSAKTAVFKATKSYAEATKTSPAPATSIQQARSKSPDRPQDITTLLKILFKGLVRILTSSNNINEALPEIADMFKDLAPAADPSFSFALK